MDTSLDINRNALTPTELANCLGGITVQGIYKALKSNKIPIISTKTKRKLIPPEGVKKLLEERGFKYPKQNISFQIVKGGVGKTSLSFSLAIRASHYGARILAIDMDQQGNLTRSFDIDSRGKSIWLNIFRDNIPIKKAIIKISDNLHLIPSNLNNSRLDIELSQSAANLRDIIRDKISPIRDNYDLVIIDCPPAINKINTAVTCASDVVIIPINPDVYAMDGLDFTLVELERIKKDFKLNVDYKIIWNKYDAREKYAPFCMHEVAKRPELIDKILPVICRIDSSTKSAIFNAKSIFELPRKTAIREDIEHFTKEILRINAWADKNKG